MAEYTKRTLVMDLRIVFEGENDRELFESLRDTMAEQYDSLTQYAAVERFTLRERRPKRLRMP